MVSESNDGQLLIIRKGGKCIILQGRKLQLVELKDEDDVLVEGSLEPRGEML